ARRLVAGEPQSVQRERILVGRRPLLLDEAPQHPQLRRVECVTAHDLTSGLYLMRCGSSASGPRVSRAQSAYSPHEPSNHVACESPSKARMCVATRSRNQRSCVITTAHPAKSSRASSSARSVSTSRSLVGSSSSSTLPPLFSSFARWTRLRPPPENTPTGLFSSAALEPKLGPSGRAFSSPPPSAARRFPSPISSETLFFGSTAPRV